MKKVLELTEPELDLLLDYIGRIREDIKRDDAYHPNFKNLITKLWNKLVKLHNEAM